MIFAICCRFREICSLWSTKQCVLHSNIVQIEITRRLNYKNTMIYISQSISQNIVYLITIYLYRIHHTQFFQLSFLSLSRRRRESQIQILEKVISMRLWILTLPVHFPPNFRSQFSLQILLHQYITTHKGFRSKKNRIWR